MVAAVDQADLAVDDLEAERAFHHRLADTVFNGGYPLARDGAASDLFLEHEARAARQRLHLDDNVAELAMAAGLLLMAALLGDGFPDGFTIADRGRVRLHLNAIAALEAGNHGVEMLVIDAAQPHLMVRFVVLDDKGAILFLKPLEGA